MRAKALAFLDQFGAEAHRLGWTSPQLFGVHPEHGFLRVEYAGALMVNDSSVVGVEPDRQRAGIGSALLAPIVERCDRDFVPAYLESSREDNLAFYHRLGFEVTGRIDLPGGGPPIWPMWRAPRP